MIIQTDISCQGNPPNYVVSAAVFSFCDGTRIFKSALNKDIFVFNTDLFELEAIYLAVKYLEKIKNIVPNTDVVLCCDNANAVRWVTCNKDTIPKNIETRNYILKIVEHIKQLARKYNITFIKVDRQHVLSAHVFARNVRNCVEKGFYNELIYTNTLNIMFRELDKNNKEDK